MPQPPAAPQPCARSGCNSIVHPGDRAVVFVGTAWHRACWRLVVEPSKLVALEHKIGRVVTGTWRRLSA